MRTLVYKYAGSTEPKKTKLEEAFTRLVLTKTNLLLSCHVKFS